MFRKLLPKVTIIPWCLDCLGIYSFRRQRCLQLLASFVASLHQVSVFLLAISQEQFIHTLREVSWSTHCIAYLPYWYAGLFALTLFSKLKIFSYHCASGILCKFTSLQGAVSCPFFRIYDDYHCFIFCLWNDQLWKFQQLFTAFFSHWVQHVLKSASASSSVFIMISKYDSVSWKVEFVDAQGIR